MKRTKTQKGPFFKKKVHLELPVCEIVQGAVVEGLEDKVELVVGSHPRAEPIFFDNLLKRK